MNCFGVNCESACHWLQDSLHRAYYRPHVNDEYSLLEVEKSLLKILCLVEILTSQAGNGVIKP